MHVHAVMAAIFHQNQITVIVKSKLQGVGLEYYQFSHY